MSGKYNRKDRFYLKAKNDGVKSRAYFKIEEIQKKYKIIKPGMKIIELGAWPGSWLQYLAKVIGQKGLALGLDLKAFENLNEPCIKTIQGDVRDATVIKRALELVDGKFDVLLSDMAPHLSGVREADNAACLELWETALELCNTLLKPGGSFVIKVFKSQESELFFKKAKQSFQILHREQLDSTRKTSKEYYIVGLNAKGC